MYSSGKKKKKSVWYSWLASCLRGFMCAMDVSAELAVMSKIMLIFRPCNTNTFQLEWVRRVSDRRCVNFWEKREQESTAGQIPARVLFDKPAPAVINNTPDLISAGLWWENCLWLLPPKGVYSSEERLIPFQGTEVIFITLGILFFTAATTYCSFHRWIRLVSKLK